MAPCARSVVGWADTQLRALASASARARRTASCTVRCPAAARPSRRYGEGERVGSDEAYSGRAPAAPLSMVCT